MVFREGRGEDGEVVNKWSKTSKKRNKNSPPFLFYLGNVTKVVPGDDRVSSRRQDEKLRDHCVWRWEAVKRDTTLDRIDGINRFRMPFSTRSVSLPPASLASSSPASSISPCAPSQSRRPAAAPRRSGARARPREGRARRSRARRRGPAAGAGCGGPRRRCGRWLAGSVRRATTGRRRTMTTFPP